MKNSVYFQKLCHSCITMMTNISQYGLTEMMELSDWEQKMKGMMNREDFKFRC